MITAIVNFPLPAKVSLAEAKGLYEASSERYRAVPGLIRKYYLFDAEGVGGGVYLWESRAAAEALYNDEWKASIKERFGTAPDIRYFDTPVIVDNAVGEVMVAAE